MEKSHDEMIVGGVRTPVSAADIAVAMGARNQAINPVFSSLIFKCPRIGPLAGTDG